MDRIYLTKYEKESLRHVRKNQRSQPLSLSPLEYQYAISLLQEKGLVSFKTDGKTVLYAELTIKGKMYFEHNKKLRNPIPWKCITQYALMAITAISTLLSLFLK